jgi:hypothetical protein
MSSISNVVVEQISSKDRTTRFGVKKVYSFKAGGEWFSTNFKNPMLSAGDTVSFEFAETSYGKEVDPASIKKGAAGAAPTPLVAGSKAPSAAPSAPYSRMGVFPIPALDGQRSIIRQNALTNARELVIEMVKGAGERAEEVTKPDKLWR